MYDRFGIKTWAKQRLTDYRWPVVLVTFLAGLLGALESGGVNLELDSSAQVEVPMDSVWGSAMLVVILVVLAAALVYGIFVGNLIHVGYHGWMLRYARGENPPVGELFASFRVYKPVMTTMLQHDVYVFLWTLLFIVPGIIKSYAYSMTRYIIYENPNLTPDQAISLSCKLTEGYKMELFVLRLSFFGWNLLSGLTLGILGLVYVNPYMYLSEAATYDWLKRSALATGRVTWEEFGMVPPPVGGAEPMQEE